MHDDWKEFLEILLNNEVEFMIAGAHAMSVYGYSRATGDIDIWVRATEVNGQRILQSLTDFGFSSLGLTIDDMTAPNVIQLGVEPLRIDILKDIDGVTFEEAIHNVRIYNIDGLNIPVISRQDLIINKKATNRNKDLHDVKMLEEAQKRSKK